MARADGAPPGFLDGPDAERNVRAALEIWQQATSIAGTIAARYLAGRGLEAPLCIDGPTLRYHARCPLDRSGQFRQQFSF
jgi:hypothetical protein